MCTRFVDLIVGIAMNLYVIERKEPALAGPCMDQISSKLNK